MHDLVVRNGHVVDGTGRPGFEADVAIDGGRIAAVGQVATRGREEIDAKGLLVTPGFVDLHTHYDGQATWDPWLLPSGQHGVTTAIMGNCGVGFAPVRPEDRDWLINVMEGVEDIPGAALHEGIRWGWQTFPEYMDALDGLPHALDIGVQVPHAAVRAYVMGRRGAEDDAATPDEIARMSAIVKEALLAGALGFTTSRTSLHRSAEGKLVAGTSATVDELLGIGEALRETGLGVFEMADEHLRVAQDLPWMEELARRTGRPVVFNLSQTDFAPDLWKEVLTGLDAAAARGAPLFAQVAGRAIGILMTFRATAHPFALHPTWKALSARPWAEVLAALRTEAVRAALLAEDNDGGGMFEQYITRSFAKMYPLRTGREYEPGPDEHVEAIAAREGRRPLEIAYDLLMEQDGEGFLYFPLFNYAGGDLEVTRALHEHPRTVFGLSDGGAHCGAICDGGMPTFLLTHWARDRARGPRWPLERVVRRMTSETAAFYGLDDRGVLAPGMQADLNLIDFDRLALQRPRVVRDLPAGGRRLMQDATGYRATICRGMITLRDGAPTGATPGRLVRRGAPGRQGPDRGRTGGAGSA